ncbi:MAG: ABC transporter substrate-binding protein [Candidatus Tectomicrobia bacterium]|nr:ABC transporter substrate-binding protein [Candidatus Tectomicrobia bacterium]
MDTVRRIFAKGIAMGLVALCIALGQARAAEKVQFALDWIPIGKHAGFFAALELGYFKKAGIDLAYIRGHGSGQTVKDVAAGVAPIGFADIAAQIIFVGQNPDRPLTSLSVIHDKSMFVIFTLAGRGIRTPKDLEGKTIAATPGDGSRVIFPALAAINNVDESKVKWVDMAPGASVPSVIKGSVDGVGLYNASYPILARGAAKQGKKIYTLVYSDFGVDVYSNGVFATHTVLKEREDMVRKVVEASMKGHAWAVEHPKEAIDVFVKQYPQSDRGIAADMWEMTMDHLLTPTAARYGIGYQDAAKMKYTRDVLVKYFKLPHNPALESIYTNKYTPKLFPRRKTNVQY